MSNIEHESTSNMEERCQELIIVARQWEEQMTDLRLYTEIEKETLENEISCLLSKNEQEKQSLENSLMQLEEERVRTCASNDLSVQSRMETEVKLQLMESALEAVSLQSMTDTSVVTVELPTPPPAVLVHVPCMIDSSTSTADISIPSDEETTPGLGARNELKDSQASIMTPEVIDAIEQHSDSDTSTRNGTNNLDSEKLALQLEVRKLRHELIVSQITAKQFKSECLLYKAKATGSTSTSTGTLLNKKRKDFCASPSSKGPPPKQCLRPATSTSVLPPRAHHSSSTSISSARTTAALQNIENIMRRPLSSDQPPVLGAVVKNIETFNTKEVVQGGKERREMKIGGGGGNSAASYSVNMIDGSDMFINNICLRM